MDSYYVTIRSARDDFRAELRFSAESFAHAEEQAVQHLESYGADAEIIGIEKDYK